MAERSTDPSYVLKWLPGASSSNNWFIRGILPDRSYYGEITSLRAGNSVRLWVSGKLTASDHSRLASLARLLDNAPLPAGIEAAPFIGLIADGPVTNPNARVFYKYDPATPRPGLDEAFRETVGIMSKYLS